MGFVAGLDVEQSFAYVLRIVKVMVILCPAPSTSTLDPEATFATGKLRSSCLPILFTYLGSTHLLDPPNHSYTRLLFSICPFFAETLEGLPMPRRKKPLYSVLRQDEGQLGPFLAVKGNNSAALAGPDYFMSRTTDPADASSLHQADLTNVKVAGSLPFKLFQHCQGQYRMTDGFEEVYEL
ncbi:hypothetical protein CVT26_002378 [Gymnopilus dilepis]|uniref:Uncharacterized protein n=1 Tax=Gymnopilus dilepis TaxID=231916 RepID=A0A409Y3Q2_9AGAR|nr:hypothetical protein CVT26_002378 [Gymnopilus dilepis]